MPNQPRGKRWCFTINNYTDDDIHRLDDIICQYIVYGEEIGSQEHTPHLQGFIYLTSNLRFNQVKKLLGENAHIELARGTNQEAADYCKKDGNFKERGTLPPERGASGGEATKRKWEEAYHNAAIGNFDEIPCDLRIRYRSQLKAIYQEELNRNTIAIGDWDLKKHFIWIYGPTGTGKSHMARSLAMSIDMERPPYLKGLNKWWSGYQQEKVVIIEEASPEACKFITPLFKQWCDKWPFAAETKGGHFEHGIRPEYIFITSNYSIAECFPDENDQGPMKRRCYEFYKETKESWLPFNFEVDTTQVLPPEPVNPNICLHDTQVTIETDAEDEPLTQQEEPTLKVASHI